jgi:hypothetical protein
VPSWRKLFVVALLPWTASAACSDEAVDRDATRTRTPDENAAGQPGSAGDPAHSAGAPPDDGGPSAGRGGSASASGGSKSPNSGPGGTNSTAGSLVGVFGGQPDPGPDPDPAHGSGTLGSSCDAVADCQPGLSCITGGTALLGDRSLPHGLCSLPCTSHEQCIDQDAGSLCFPFDPEATEGYCVEGCAFGDPSAGAQKCHNRLDFACLPALLFDTGEPCVSNASCQPGDTCLDGRCALVLPACLPSCRGDLDCASGSYCDQSFLNGLCTTQPPTGKGLGEPCTVPASSEPAEPDDCLGFCLSDGDGSSNGHCATTCGLLNGCAWEPDTEQFAGACLYPSALTTELAGAGDFGFCTPACNCSDECLNETLECTTTTFSLSDAFSGPGLCFSKEPGSTTHEECR